MRAAKRGGRDALRPSMAEPPRVLVTDDDGPTRDRVRRLLGDRIDASLFTSVTDTLAWLETVERVDGAVIDLGLPDGSGYEILRTARMRFPTIPMLVLTGKYDPRSINRVQLLDAQYIMKPDFEANVRAFVERVFARALDASADVNRRLHQLLSRYQLTPRERDVLTLAVDGVPRSHLPDALGVTENTVKTQIRSLLSKCQATSLAELVWRVRSEPADAS